MSIIIELIGNLLCSMFLTYLVSLNTLTTKLQVIFVFVYFVFMNYVFRVIYQKVIKKGVPKRKCRIYAIAGLIAVFVTCFSVNKTYPRHYDSDIYLVTQGESNSESNSNEIWISSIKVDDLAVNLAELPLDGKWQYENDSAAIHINPEYGNEVKFLLSLPQGKDVAITFLKHEWSGIVEIQNEESVITEDLYSKTSAEAVCKLQRTAKEPDITVKIVLWICCFITLYRVSVLITTYFYYHYIKTYNH